MADSTTTNLLLTKPEVGASTDTWGTKINTDLDSVDAIFAAAGTGTSVGLNIGAGKTLKVAGTTDFSANLTFTGTGNRITGDFSNATTANKVMLQTSTTNGATVVNLIPAGTGNSSGFNLFNDSGFTNCARFDIGLLNAGSEARLSSTIVGAGTYVPMTFLTGGSERVRIDTSGNVGIGLTSSPIASSTATGVWLTPTDGAVIADNATVLSLNRNGTGGNDRMNFEVYNNGTLRGGIGTLGASDGIYFTTGSTERVRIDSSGQFFVGTTSNPGGGTSVAAFSGADVLNVNNTTAGTGSATSVYFKRNATTVGTIAVTGTLTSYNVSSDYRLKNTIAPMTGALAKVALLKPCTYKWNVDGSDGQGFIAHELDEVVPGCVTGEKDAVEEQQYEVTPAVKDEEGNTITEAVMGTRTVPVYQGIDTSFLVATLTAAIQEQQALITALTTRITALEAA